MSALPRQRRDGGYHTSPGADAAWARGWLRRYERQLGVDPARGVDECGRIASFQACATLRNQPPTSWWALNRLRGRCAEESLIEKLCRHNYAVSNQVWAHNNPTRRRQVLDITTMTGPTTRRRLKRGIESKYINGASYLRRGQAGMADLRRRVHAHVAQVRAQMQAATGPQATPNTPTNIILHYAIGQVSPPDFQRLVRLMAAARDDANRTAPPVTVSFERVTY